MKLRLRTTLYVLMLAWCSNASAGGLWLNEYGAPVMGRAAAGAEAGVDDASTGLYNPATMTRLKSSQFMASGGLIVSDVEFDVDRGSLLNGQGDGGSAGGVAPAASMFYTRPLSEKWHIGTNFYGLTGSALDYNKNWAGRFQATDVELVFLALQPTIAYQVNDHLSIGAGLLLGYTKLELTVAVPDRTTPLLGPDGRAVLDGDDTEIGFSVGMLWELGDSTRIGINYQSELEPSYAGDVRLEPTDTSVGVDTELPLAALARIGMTHQFNEQWSGHLSFGWEDWDALDSLLITTESNGIVADRGWEDTYHYAAGLSYKLDRAWLLNMGIAYDTNPADKNLRTADLPVDRQVRYAFGAVHTRASGLEVGLHAVYADYGSAAIDSLGYAGDYSRNHILFTSMSVNWRL